MLRVAEGLSNKYSPRVYVVAASDEMSEDKIRVLETKKNREDVGLY